MEKIAIIYGNGYHQVEIGQRVEMWIFMRCFFAVNLADNYILDY